MLPAFLPPAWLGARACAPLRVCGRVRLTRAGVGVRMSVGEGKGDGVGGGVKSDVDEGSVSSTLKDMPMIDEGVDSEVYIERMKTLFSDLSQRPFYYSTILGYVVGAVVVLTVLRAIVSAIDSLPILPGALELIGLGYTAWFIWRYVLFRESRTELLEEIEDFFGRTRSEGDQ